jgi:phospholipase C
MRLDSRRLATLALPLAFVSASPVMAAPVSPETENLVRQYRAELRGHVKHIVIVIQENRSVDNLFNGLPGADTVRFGHSHSGLVAMHPVDLSFPADVDHQHRAFLTEFNDGRMDGWDRARSYPPQGPDFPYAYVPREQVEPYWDMAERYTFADRMFQSNTGPSFPAHLYLVAGESANTASNPNHLETTQFAWGCDSPPGATVTVLDKRGDERPGPFPCLEFNTLADLADAAHVSWRYYAPPLESLGSIWSAFDAIRHIRYGPQWSNVISPETRVLTDARSGDLPAISWVVPTAENSDHPFPRKPSSVDVAVPGQYGPDWVASIVNAIGSGPLWDSWCGTTGAGGTITSHRPRPTAWGSPFASHSS